LMAASSMEQAILTEFGIMTISAAPIIDRGIIPDIAN